jgi:hypothetical protein
MSKKVSLVVKETWWSNEHDNFVIPEAKVPEGDKLNREDVKTSTTTITKHTKSAIVQEMSRERTIHMMLENIYQRNPEDPLAGIKQFVADCHEKTKNVYHELFAEPTPTGETILENDALARELLNYCLGMRWQEKWFTSSQRTELKQLLFELNSDADETDILTNLMSLMPESLHGANKMDLMSKVSILLLFVANSHPEKFAKMDEFFEKQVLIDAMVSGKSFSQAIQEILNYAGAFEAKNTGQVYNYRVDNLFQFAHAAQEWLAKIPEFLWKTKRTDWLKRQRANKNHPALRLFQDRYEMVQKHMFDFSKQWTSPEQNHQLYVLLTKLYTLQHVAADKKQPSSLIYLSDLGEGYQEWVEHADEQVQDYFADLLAKARNKNILNYSKYENISEYFSLEWLQERTEKKELLLVWWAEAVELAEKSEGKIVLRLDRKIDFYDEHGEMICKWLGRLSVGWPSEQGNGLLQGHEKDVKGNKGTHWISYMTWERAMKEVMKQWLKLFSGITISPRKILGLLEILGTNKTKQSQALQVLFWTDFSGYWNPYNKLWIKVGLKSYLALSEITSAGNVWTVDYTSTNAACNWFNDDCFLPYLACEEVSYY